MRIRNKIKSFDPRELQEISFGLVEGEKDEHTLRKSLITTKSINDLLRSHRTFVVGPRGSGKSAITNAYKNHLFPTDRVDYKRIHFITINSAFTYNNEYLSPAKFHDNLPVSSYVVSWALYLAFTLVGDIFEQHKHSTAYQIAKKKLNRIKSIRNRFDLYNIKDFVNKMGLQLKFNVLGNNVGFSPKLPENTLPIEIDLNDVFTAVNEFYMSSGLCVILTIDRIDDFVARETQSVQQKYIQGLSDAIEEIGTLTNIQPMLCLRSDLFERVDLAKSYDKVEDRVLELRWTREELLRFIVRRLIANKYIKDNFYPYLKLVLHQESRRDHRSRFSAILEDWRNRGEQRVTRNLDERVVTRFLRLFFPVEISIKIDDIDKSLSFTDWLFTCLADHKGYISPRVIVSFFNKLFSHQYESYQGSVDPYQTVSFLESSKVRGFETLGVFTKETCMKALSDVQRVSVKMVHRTLKEPILKKWFKSINEVAASGGVIRKRDIPFIDKIVHARQWQELVVHLESIGYLKEVENQVYTVPILYQHSLFERNE